MREIAASATTPIFMAGGVWYLREWEDWIDNPELGPIAFQFGTRPLLTQESPISEAWKRRLLTLHEGDVFLNRFSPTGFYSSAVQQPVPARAAGALRAPGRLHGRRRSASMSAAFPVGARGRMVYLTAADKLRASGWVAEGFTEALRTPDSTLIFVTPEKAQRDPHRSDQLHGLPQRLPVLELGAERAGHDRQEGRSALLSASRRRCRRSATPTIARTS